MNFKKGATKTFWQFGILLLAILIFAGIRFLSSITPCCGKNSAQAEMARALSQDRLEELHRQMRELRGLIAQDALAKASGLRGDAIPKEFKDLNCKKVRPGGLVPCIMLEGCFDHFLYLRFYGVGEPEEFGDHSPRITLQYGEHDVVEEVLWRSRERKSEQTGSSDADKLPN